MKKISFLLLTFILMFYSCDIFNMGGDDDYNEDPIENPDGTDGTDGSGTPQHGISFNFTGAKAVGVAEFEGVTNNSRNAEDAFGLVRVMEDGSIEMAMEVPEGVWMPDVSFIAKSPIEGSSDLYVAFESNFYYYEEIYDENGYWVDSVEHSFGSFLHIKEDGTYVDILGESGGSIKNYTWWGNDDFKPVSFDNNGRIYYITEEWVSDSYVEVLCAYDPLTENTTEITAAIEGYHYNQFEISPDGSKLFVMGERYSSTGNNSSFFRMHPTNNPDNYKNIYYSSQSNVWVRGFKVSPDSRSLVLNGYNIRGNNGIIKVDIISDTELEYKNLYDSSTDWFSPVYSEWDSWDGNTYEDGFFDENYKYNLDVQLTDGTNFYYDDLEDLIGSPTSSNVHLYTSNTYKSFTLGSDIYFALDSIDPSKKSTALNWNEAKDFAFVVKSEWQSLSDTYLYKTIDNRDAIVDYYTANPGENYAYTWNSKWFVNDSRGSGVLDYDAILSEISTYYITDVDFQKDTLTGSDALASLLLDEVYSSTDIYGTASDNYYFFNTYLRDSSGNVPKSFRDFRIENDLAWLNFENIGNLFYNEENALWGVLSDYWGNNSKPTPVKLLDANGNRDLSVVDAFKGDTYMPVGFVLDGNNMIFRDALTDSDGIELGYHKIYSFSVNEANPTPVDLLVNVAGNGRLEIVDFSAGAGYVYFTAVHGREVVGGKVNLSTLAFTPFETGYRLTNIEVY